MTEYDPTKLVQEIKKEPVEGSTVIKSINGFNGRPVPTIYPWYENVGLIDPH